MTAVLAFDGEFSGSISYRDADGKRTWMVALGMQLVVGGQCIRSLMKVFAAPADGTFEPRCRAEFWDKSPMKEMLGKWLLEGEDPRAVMADVHAFIRQAEAEYSNTIIVCDATIDAAWLHMYMREYGPPEAFGLEARANGVFSGNPIVADDQYRGALGVNDMWDVNPKVATKFDFQYKRCADHNPANDAAEIGINYWRYLNARGLIEK